MGRHKILPGLTTTPGSDWKEKIREIDNLNIREIALFPTYLEIDLRRELYRLLDNTGLESIPHVHLRDDMEAWELDYLAERFRAEVFNVHPDLAAINFIEANREYAKRIYVENCWEIDEDFITTLALCKGICLDFAHWDDGSFHGWKGYGRLGAIALDNKVGCCHISAVRSKPYLSRWNRMIKNSHHLQDLSELDYMKKYVKYLPEIISIELENSFKEQLRVKKYLEEMINI